MGYRYVDGVDLNPENPCPSGLIARYRSDSAAVVESGLPN